MQQRSPQMLRALLWAALLCVLAPWRAQAQSVTTAAVVGRVTNEQGAPVSGVQIVVTNRSTGRVAGVVTREDGRYRLQGLAPGGPYTVEARMVGYAPQARENVALTLGQTASFDFVLTTQAVALEGITAVGERNTVLSRGRTGASAVVSDSAVSRSPTITRDFTDFTRLVPQISTAGEGSNALGRSSRFNIIQIDGAANNDIFGLGSAGTPGSGSDAKPITLDAIQQFEVVIAPFDVRQGGFTGAAINAVTKSGSNDFRGSVSVFNRNEALVGRFVYPGTDSLAPKYENFRHTETSVWVGGPILRDKLHFSVAGELTRRSAPISNVAGTPASEITMPEVQQIAEILRTQYGYQPGELASLELRTPSQNAFARLDWSINPSHRLTVRHNYVSGEKDDLSRSNALYRVGGSLFVRENTTNSSVAELNSSFAGGFFNQLRVGYSTIEDVRVPQDNMPSVRIDLPAGPGGGTRRLFAGSEQFSGKNELSQDVLELTNDLTFARGRHSFTLGTHNEFFSFSNLFVRNAFGYYEFTSPAALAAGTPSRYEYSYLLPGGRERAEFDVRQFGFYGQDQIELTDNLTVTLGLRYDVTSFPENPGRNPAFETAFKTDSATVGGAANALYGRNTSQIPSGNSAFSPRFGFNWDVLGDRSLQLRGGAGIFAGRTPYVWISNAYGNTGIDYLRFTCTGSGVPRFVADPTNQPRACTGTTNPTANEINLADPDFESPQVARYSLAVDRDLWFGFVGTLEGIYTQTLYDVLYRELNLGAPTAQKVEGRTRYAGRRISSFANVTEITNTDEGYSYSLTAQLQRSFRSGWDLQAAYTRAVNRDVNSLVSSQAFSNFQTNPIDDDPNDPDLRPSNYDVPNRVLVSGSYKLEWSRRAPLDVSFIYTGESGRPYSYTYSGDVNNDGSNQNDLLYVPRDPSDIRFTGTPAEQATSWQNLNAFIESVDCLRENRGRVLPRNACRQPWRNRFDVRLAQTIPTLRGQGLQAIVNVINVANLLNDEWGIDRYVFNQRHELLATSSTTPDANGKVLFRPFGAGRRQFDSRNLDSRYQVQLGLRYSF
mgnify:CR=1 FL=1